MEVWDCRRDGKRSGDKCWEVKTNWKYKERKWRMGEIMEADMKKALGKYAEVEMGEEGREWDP